MAHERFRKFNNASLYPGQGFGNDNCMAVRAGNHVFLRGQTGLDFDGKLVGPGDPGAQTENAMRCAQILLEEAGSKLDHICKITVYVTDRVDRGPVYEVIGKWLQGVFPVSTGLIVSGFAREDILMEIDIHAVIPDESN